MPGEADVSWWGVEFTVEAFVVGLIGSITEIAGLKLWPTRPAILSVKIKNIENKYLRKSKRFRANFVDKTS